MGSHVLIEVLTLRWRTGTSILHVRVRALLTTPIMRLMKEFQYTDVLWPSGGGKLYLGARRMNDGTGKSPGLRSGSPTAGSISSGSYRIRKGGAERRKKDYVSFPDRIKLTSIL